MSWLRGISARSLRHIDRLEIDLAPGGKARRHLVLLGANGSGKSILLEAIADELTAAVEGRAHPASELATQSGNAEAIDREIRLAHFGRPVRLTFSEPAKVVRDAFAHGKLIVAYLPDPRDTSIAPVTNAPTDTDPKKPRERTGGRLSTFLAARKTEHELAKRSNDELRAKVHEAWFLRIQATLRRLLRQPELALGSDRDGLHLDLPDGRRMSLDQLSRGHASAIAIWAEVMMRVEAARMRADDPALEPHGVVVIDGAEGDLEVRLQRELLPALAELYPNVQLVISTHSPLVALSLDDAIVYDLGARRGRLSEEVRSGGVDGLLVSMLAPEDAPTVLSPSRRPPPMPPKSTRAPARTSRPPPAFTPPPHLTKAQPTFRVPSAPPSAPVFSSSMIESDEGEKTSPSIAPPEPPKRKTAPPAAALPPRAAPLPPKVPQLTEPELASASDESLEEEPTSPQHRAPQKAKVPPKQKIQRKGQRRHKKDTLTGSGPWAPEDD